MSLYLGLRAKEIAALKWGGIFDGKDQVRDVLHLKAAYTKGSKTRSSYLAAPKLRQVLKDYGNAYGDWRQPEGALFRSHRGSNMTAGSMVRLLKQIYCEAGLPDTSSHTGRRTFIT